MDQICCEFYIVCYTQTSISYHVFKVSCTAKLDFAIKH